MYYELKFCWNNVAEQFIDDITLPFMAQNYVFFSHMALYLNFSIHKQTVSHDFLSIYLKEFKTS